MTLGKKRKHSINVKKAAAMVTCLPGHWGVTLVILYSCSVSFFFFFFELLYCEKGCLSASWMMCSVSFSIVCHCSGPLSFHGMFNVFKFSVLFFNCELEGR